MKRMWHAAGLAALLAGLALMLGSSQAQEDKTPSIKDIMTKAHKGGNSLLKQIGRELQASDVPWKKVDEQAEELVRLGKALAKNTPEKGEKASWEKLTTSYQKNAQALEKAAEKENKSAATAALKKLTGSCKACHSAHKGS